jgi:hypothetical protein
MKVTMQKKYTAKNTRYILVCRVYGRKKLNEYSQRTHITPAVPGEYQDRGEIIVMHKKLKKTKLHGLSPQANYTDRLHNV